MLEKEALQAQISCGCGVRAGSAAGRASTDWRAWRFRTVTMTGEFDARHQILIDNKVHAGRVGFAVVTPLSSTTAAPCSSTAAGSRAARRAPCCRSRRRPQGVVTLRGRIDIPPAGYLELGDRAPPAGPLWQHLDPQRFAQATGIAVLPIVVEALDMPATTGWCMTLPLPDTGIGKHVSYMMQWYTFAAMAAGLWLWFTVRPRLRRRCSAPTERRRRIAAHARTARADRCTKQATCCC